VRELTASGAFASTRVACLMLSAIADSMLEQHAMNEATATAGDAKGDSERSNDDLENTG
jgi:hypothetical protein